MKYELQPDRSTIAITAHATMHDTHATSRGLEGHFDVTLDDDLVPSGDVHGRADVRLDSFKSGNPVLDATTLRTIGAKKHPVAALEILTAVGDDGGVRVTGNLTFAGVTSSVESEIALQSDDDGNLRITTAWVLDLRTFNVRPPRLGPLKVGDKIDVTLDLVATAV